MCRLTAKCSEKAPMIAVVARRITWSRLWDSALDLGVQYLSLAMSHHGCGNHPCPLCDTAPLPVTVLDHLLDCHSSSLFLNPTLSSDGLIDNSISVFCVTLASFSCVFVLTLGCIDELLNFELCIACMRIANALRRGLALYH